MVMVPRRRNAMTTQKLRRSHEPVLVLGSGPSPVHLQDVRRDAVLLAAIEGLGVEHDVGAVARLGADDAALAAQLHPGHRQDGPGHTETGEELGSVVVVVVVDGEVQTTIIMINTFCYI